jgi:hypothetical protein
VFLVKSDFFSVHAVPTHIATHRKASRRVRASK